MGKIGKDTVIPISLVLVICGTAFGYGVLSNKVEAHEITINKVSISQEQFHTEVRESLQDARERLVRIETILRDKRGH